MYQLKAKDSGMKSYPLFLSNVSKSFTINNLKETGSKENAKKILLLIFLLILTIFYISIDF